MTRAPTDRTIQKSYQAEQDRGASHLMFSGSPLRNSRFTGLGDYETPGIPTEK